MCSECVCRYCFNWWGHRCPYGSCYEDAREVKRCHHGVFHPEEDCEHFIQYEGQKIVECHKANYQEFQDGSRVCCMMDDNGTCSTCIAEMTKELEGR